MASMFYVTCKWW